MGGGKVERWVVERWRGGWWKGGEVGGGGERRQNGGNK